MVNKSYAIGYRFCERVKKLFESKGYFVVKNPKSQFPDLFAWRKGANGFFIFAIESKVNKYLSKEEKKRATTLLKNDNITALLVAWRKNHKIKLYKFERK